jgi:hypothetical protein
MGELPSKRISREQAERIIELEAQVEQLTKERDSYIAGMSEQSALRHVAEQRITELEALLEKMASAYVAASRHIIEELQPEFMRLAEGKPLTWPKAWSEPYDETVAANRLATWWHGIGFDEFVGEARAALRESEVGAPKETDG